MLKIWATTKCSTTLPELMTWEEKKSLLRHHHLSFEPGGVTASIIFFKDDIDHRVRRTECATVVAIGIMNHDDHKLSADTATFASC
mmetsp:Transcript_113636/g.226127  ORF Transcript_113636/g.226127 Transcript_113636/m.226127 type:complete len:86 (+) Transcript_113636:102-359(+)